MIPAPGIYRGIPSEEYFSWDAVSNSRLSLMRRSPKHYQCGYGEPTEAMKLGSLVHCGVLEPLAIAKRYVFMPDYAKHPDNVTRSGSRSFKATTWSDQMELAFRNLHHDKEIISEPDYERMVGMVSALCENEVARDLFRGGEAEVSFVWVDSKTGLLCKCRVDWLRPGKFVDYKTSQNAVKFDKAIAEYGYHRQMAFYRRGLAANGIDAEPWLVCQDKSAPFGCRAAPLSQDALEIGAQETDELLQRVLECQQSGVWPGYDNPPAWNVPEWYAKSVDVELVIDGELLSV